MASHSIAGLFGNPIAHSRSPSLHNFWFEKYQIDARYLLFSCNTLPEFQVRCREFLESSSSLGCNITIPFKSDVLEVFDFKKSVLVEQSQVGNTLYRDSAHRWCIENTDVYGVLETLKALEPLPSQIIILGNGATARSVATAIGHLDANLEITILSRTSRRKTDHSAIRYLTYADFLYDIPSNPTQPHVVVNTIPLGHQGETNVFAETVVEHLSTGIFFDVIYSNTPALRFAEKRGWKCVNGETMFVAQAKQSFSLWTGIVPQG